MNTGRNIVMIILLALAAGAAQAEDVLAHYAAAGPFSAERGKALWERDGITAEGKLRRCATCHGSDLAKSGSHAKSGETIDPMAHSANAKRYTDLAKVEKWFKRNCKWTFDRECTAQEKGDVLTYLLSL